MSWMNKVKDFEHMETARVKELMAAKPLLCHVTDAFNGRCTFFAVVFTVCGIILAFQGKLTMQYVALVGSIQGLIVAHSAKEDYHERNSGPDTPQNS